MPTKQQLNSAARKLLDVFCSWRDADGPVVLQRGRTRKSISEPLSRAIGELIELCETNDFRGDCRWTVLAVDRVAAEWDRWRRKWEAAPGTVDPSGTRALWSAVEHVERSIKLRRRVRFESPQLLAAMPGMTHRQIAKIHGWRTPDGKPDTTRVEEELATPGTHVKPGTESPECSRRRAERDAAWQKRVSHRARHRKCQTNLILTQTPNP